MRRLVFVSSLLLVLPLTLSLTEQGHVLLNFTHSLQDPSDSLSFWNPQDSTPCNWPYVSCSSSYDVTSLRLSKLNLHGSSDPSVLCQLPHLTSLDLSHNFLNSTTLSSFSSCTSLTYLDLSDNYINTTLSSFSSCTSLTYLDLSMNNLEGPLPPLPPSLLHLDLSSNYFSGVIPPSYGSSPRLVNLTLSGNMLIGIVPPSLGNITTLKHLHLADNPTFSPGPVPAELGNLTSLERLFLRSCNLVGSIPSSLGNLENLLLLDLCQNSLSGSIPESIVGLSKVQQIELYENMLSGELPNGMANLTSLVNIDLNSNHLVGNIPPELFHLPLLESLHLYNNSFVGTLPTSVAGAKSLHALRLFMNDLTGELPFDLGMTSPLRAVELSQNRFTGNIPSGICRMGALNELVMIENQLSGPLPDGLGRCSSLQRLRLSNNRLSGKVPEGLWALPSIYFIDLADNMLSGPILGRISEDNNISTLALSNNRFDGSLPSTISSLKKLDRLSAANNNLYGRLPASLGELAALESLDLSNNSISGELPQEVSNWRRLSELNLSSNELTGSIPEELGDLPVLTRLDLSNNRLTGDVPVSLQKLRLTLLNLSNNDLSGTLPPSLATDMYKDSFLGNPGLCNQIPGLCPASTHKNRSSMWILRAIFMLAVVILVVGIGWVYWRYRAYKKRARWTLRSFHKLGFTEEEILKGLDEAKVIGLGSSGKVYKVELNSGEIVAVKQLYGMKKEVHTEEEQGDVDDEENGGGRRGDYGFEKEVAMLGNIRHKNIVKLWCSCTHQDRRFLVYEYMPNGSLADLLHGSGQKRVLNWKERYQIAVDAAEGLAYLHHDCSPPIIHRDVKSSNILLDANLHARLSDFGVAKAMEIEGSAAKSLSVVAGTRGYLAPEYAYTLRINERSDTYSFGVVLLEMVTGKRAIDPEFRDKDLASWVAASALEPTKIVDQKLGDSFDDEICMVLGIALQCIDTIPLKRPVMRKVVKMLHDVRLSTDKSKKEKNEQNQGLSPYYFEDGGDAALIR